MTNVWPEAELKALRRWHEQAAEVWKEGSNMRRDHERRRQVCDEALRYAEALQAELQADIGSVLSDRALGTDVDSKVERMKAAVDEENAKLPF